MTRRKKRCARRHISIYSSDVDEALAGVEGLLLGLRFRAREYDEIIHGAIEGMSGAACRCQTFAVSELGALAGCDGDMLACTAKACPELQHIERLESVAMKAQRGARHCNELIDACSSRRRVLQCDWRYARMNSELVILGRAAVAFIRALTSRGP